LKGRIGVVEQGFFATLRMTTKTGGHAEPFGALKGRLREASRRNTSVFFKLDHYLLEPALDNGM
jgi:hypothetical protein